MKFGLIPEFVGRVPICVSLRGLDREALIRILQEPKNALVKQYQKLFQMDNVELSFEQDAIEAIADKALERKTGARGLRSIMESVMMDTMYEIPSETVCGITSKLPENIHPEVAFAGKSNVGKSSLINGLMNRKSLARTSSQPGKTQTINYYNINDEIYFVDLPGYGYAQANEHVKAQWGKMIEDYLHKSKQLKLVFLLIDIRHAPSENDRIMYDWIRRNGYDPIIIATKLDKINRSQIQKQVKLIRTTLQAGADTQIVPYSAQTKQGREEIYEILDGVLAAEDPAQE